MSDRADVDSAAGRRVQVGALVAALGPPGAWLVAFGLAYVVQDFGCSAVETTEALSRAGIRAVVLAIYVVGLLAIVGAGLIGLRLLRATSDDRLGGPWLFLSWTGAVLGLCFAFALVMVAWPAIVLEVCG